MLLLVEVDGDRKDRDEHEEERNFCDPQTSESLHDKGEYQVGREAGDAKHTDVNVDIVAKVGGA